MQGSPARGQHQPPSESTSGSAAAEWYAVTSDGASALRLAPGLTLGESEAGALLLNDPDPRHQWVELDVDERGNPSLAIITRDRSLMVEGERRMRHPLDVGVRVNLPGNTLYVSRDMRLPATSGPVVEVVSREVPARPDDIVGGSWAEGLQSIHPGSGFPPGPAPASSATEAAEWVRVTDDDATAKLDESGPAAEGVPEKAPQAPRGPASDEGMTRLRPAAVAQPGRRVIGRRHRKGGNTLTLVTVSAVAVLAGLAGGLAVTGWLDGDGAALPQAALDVFDPPADEPPYDGGVGDGPNRAEEALARPDAVDAAAADAGPAVAATGATENAAAPSAGAERAGATGLPDDRETGPSVEQAQTPAVTPPEGADAAAISDAGTGQELRADAPPDWRLTRARDLMDAGYITYPPEANAVTYLERLLADDPGNRRAMAMLDEASTRLIDAAVRAHRQGLDYEARNTLEEVFGFDPADERANRLWREWVGTER